MQTSTGLKERTKWAINYILKQNNLRIMDISRAIGSKPDTIRKYRAKIATPRVNFLQRLCAAFGVDFQWVTTGAGKPFPGRNVEFTEALSGSHDTPHQADQNKKTDQASVQSAHGDSDETYAESEMSFQKLAVLAGIKIDNKWIVNLSNTIGVPPWKISLSIYHQRIDGELIQAAENFGFERKAWIVGHSLNPHASEPGADAGSFQVSQLLKMAEELLRSNTIHATSLAMNIISLKTVSEEDSPAPVSGARAISLP